MSIIKHSKKRLSKSNKRLVKSNKKRLSKSNKRLVKSNKKRLSKSNKKRSSKSNKKRLSKSNKRLSKSNKRLVKSNKRLVKSNKKNKKHSGGFLSSSNCSIASVKEPGFHLSALGSGSTQIPGFSIPDQKAIIFDPKCAVSQSQAGMF